MPASTSSRAFRIAGTSTAWWDDRGSVDCSVARKKVTFRPPGLKPTTKVGTFGPYRGRLGLAWVIAPIVAGAVILIAGYFALR